VTVARRSTASTTWWRRKATAILKDFSESFFSGEIRYSDGTLSSEKGAGFDLVDAAGKRRICSERSYAPHGGGRPRIPVKIGNGSFRDQVELNQLTRGPFEVTCEVAPRRGYLLATFEFQKVAAP
jgi:hypothetical protein